MCTCLFGFNGDGRNCTGEGLVMTLLVWVCLFVGWFVFVFVFVFVLFNLNVPS